MVEKNIAITGLSHIAKSSTNSKESTYTPNKYYNVLSMLDFDVDHLYQAYGVRGWMGDDQRSCSNNLSYIGDLVSVS